MGVDVGGTFTDAVLVENGRPVGVAKVPSTPDDPSRAIAAAIDQIRTGQDARTLLVHSTTVATNAILARTGARCGVITTRGFRDVVEMGRRDRPHIYGFAGAHRPIVARRDRIEVGERLAYDGTVVEALDLDEVRDAGRQLLSAGVAAVAVCFLHSDVNPCHERQAIAALREFWPEPRYVTGSADLYAEAGEFVRFATAAANGYLQPVVSAYLGRLVGRLSDLGHAGPVLVMQSSGGVASIEQTRDLAIGVARSGPVAGVVAAAEIGRRAGLSNIVTCDIGGTSADVSVVVDGRPRYVNDASLGFRLPLVMSTLDVVAVGAGGGSIARVDELGVLTVGPDSAGADPGPACYGQGGTAPTVTDAALLLGHIDPDARFGTGRQSRLDPDLAAAAVRSVAEPLGIPVPVAARGILAVATTTMANAIRSVLTARGHDPREFTLVSFGGGGGLHACALLRETGMRAALVPRHPGLVSALGCAVADLRYESSRSWPAAAADLDDVATAAALHRMLDEQEAALRERLSEQPGIAVDDVEIVVEGDLRYRGQSHHLRVPLDRPIDRAGVEKRYRQAYERRYGRTLADAVVEIVTLRSTLVAHHGDADLSGPVAGAGRGPRADGGAGGVRHRGDLAPGERLVGPLLLVADDATVHLEAGYVAEVDAEFNLLIREGA
ncbi:hydantoinase/oxoprolinase family protein [Phytohabitans sp. ZYX-F-186]|uniref:Hydantoinase/oxoprolinase family protein n=1 Tax=Phytohabitans maris TaxID=3071409 RepID=A0ABU0ZSW0_9ACTN|nr:hydantoinase/oxoprolinase family protein [Phytohabitans sp. ZYX-F-186]MDQ7910124.1 hydantoinase/oxoprolinase family protein [Phytohabitans sp. ZYX-F-186]